jgi:hypothetical protein
MKLPCLITLLLPGDPGTHRVAEKKHTGKKAVSSAEKPYNEDRCDETGKHRRHPHTREAR